MTEPPVQDFEPFLAGDAPGAWKRCLPVWKPLGRVNDFPKGVRRPKYTPLFGTRLGWEFIDRYWADYAYVLDRLGSGDKLEVACAFDLLEFMVDSRTPGDWGDTVPREILESQAPIPPNFLTELRSDHFTADFEGRTAGDYFRYLSKDSVL
jgi:hypothetical protein